MNFFFDILFVGLSDLLSALLTVPINAIAQILVAFFTA